MGLFSFTCIVAIVTHNHLVTGVNVGVIVCSLVAMYHCHSNMCTGVHLQVSVLGYMCSSLVAMFRCHSNMCSLCSRCQCWCIGVHSGCYEYGEVFRHLSAPQIP